MSSSSAAGEGYTGVPGMPALQSSHVELVDPSRDRHNTSRLSHLSHGSNLSVSTIQLGGVDYSVGSRVGQSFVIGDPHTNDPNRTRDSTSSSNADSKKQLTKDSYPVVEKGYDFEYWNWTVVRFCCLGFVLCVIVALLAAVIGLVIDEKSRCKSPFKWWKGAVMYHVSVPYFCNSDADAANLGDLKGVRQKVVYMQHIGVQVVVLGNLLTSSHPTWLPTDSFTKIDTRLGSTTDLTNAIREFHAKDIKVLVELEVVFTSKSHPWFVGSSQQHFEQDNKYDNFYIWKQTIGSTGSWTEDIYRNEFYMHDKNDANRPMINWSQPEVHDAFILNLEVWLKRGVDGFVIQGIRDMLVEDDATKLLIVKGWRKLLDSYKTDDLNHKVLTIDSNYLEWLEQKANLINVRHEILGYIDLVQVPFALDFRNLTYRMREDVIAGNKWQSTVDGPSVYWKLQHLSKVDRQYITEVMLYVLMLPGNPGIIGGQEVGRNVLEEGADARPVSWRIDTIYPILAGSRLNQTTIEVLKTLISIRHNTISLRADGHIEDTENSEEQKVMNIQFPYIDEATIVLKRRFRRKDAYYFVGNFFKRAVTRDLFDVVAGGEIVCDSHSKMTGSLVLADDLTLQKGQGIVFRVKY